MLEHLGERPGSGFYHGLYKLHLQLEHTRLFMRGVLLLEIMSQFSAKCKSAAACRGSQAVRAQIITAECSANTVNSDDI